MFREYDWFIAFVIIFCPECYVYRDANKAAAMLNGAIPIHVKQEE